MKTSSFTGSEHWLLLLHRELDSLLFRFVGNEPLSFFVAREKLANIDKSEMPEHMQISPRPLKGRREVMRGSRHTNPARLVKALWHEDRMLETTSSCLCVVVEGEANLYLGDYVLRCRPGDLVFVPAGVPRGNYIPNTVDGAPQSTCKILYLYPGRLHGRGIECWISHSRGKELLAEEQRGAALIRNYFLTALFEQFGEELQRSADSVLRLSLFRSLLLFIKQEIEQSRALVPPLLRFGHQGEEGHRPIRYICDYISSHLSEPMTIELLSRKIALSPTLFKRMFRQEVGMTFHQYLTQKRMELATDLLENTDSSIEEVARRVGLKTTRLRQLFYRQHDCSPSNYRKQAVKNHVGR